MDSTKTRQYARKLTRGVGPPLLLLVLLALAYHDAPDNGFHLDDGRNIVRYPPVMMTEFTVANVVDAGRNAFLPTRPLPSMLFAIDWWRGEGSSRPFQMTNLAVHLAAAIAVFGLLALVLRRCHYPPWVARIAALSGAALWACHPIQVQAVTYIVQRMTSLAALFTVLTVTLYILGRVSGSERRRWLCFGSAIACWLLGMASKETAAVAPFLVLLAEYGVVRHGRQLIRSHWDTILLATPAVIAVLVVLDVASGAGPLSAFFLPGYDARDFTLAERLLTQPRVVVFHLSQFIWPTPGRFSLEHGFEISTALLTPPGTIAALLFVCSWCALGVWLLFRPGNRILGFFILWVPASLLIESSIIALELVFEHRMYLPSVALAGIFAAGVAGALQRLPRRVPMTLSVVALAIAFLVYSTSRYVPVWETPLSLAQNNTRHAPESARAWATLAIAMKDSGVGWDEVEPPMLKALDLNPRETSALNLRARQFVESGRLQEADRLVSALVSHAGRDPSVLNTIGTLRFEQGRYEEAVSSFQRLVEINSLQPEFHYNLALSYEYAGSCREAKNTWHGLLRLDSNAERLDAVRTRLLRHYELPGGRCSHDKE